ncbi:hypothetical protein Agub_g15263, partial [Astrephomene gubernaculifera]
QELHSCFTWSTYQSIGPAYSIRQHRWFLFWNRTLAEPLAGSKPRIVCRQGTAITTWSEVAGCTAMCHATTTSQAGAPTLPGLERLRDRVDDWEAAMTVMTLTATTIAKSVGACTSTQDPVSSHLQPPTLHLTAAQLKPGRLFIVADLQGAYYTLLDLLATHKFDFRRDNLFHTGNLVAPPSRAATPPPPPPPPSAADPWGPQPQPSPCSPSHPTTPSSCYPAPPAEPPTPTPTPATSRRARNSASVLALVRRHGVRGPMGATDCLALLAAAASACGPVGSGSRSGSCNGRGSGWQQRLAATPGQPPAAAAARSQAAAAAAGEGVEGMCAERLMSPPPAPAQPAAAVSRPAAPAAAAAAGWKRSAPLLIRKPTRTGCPSPAYIASSLGGSSEEEEEQEEEEEDSSEEEEEGPLPPAPSPQGPSGPPAWRHSCPSTSTSSSSTCFSPSGLDDPALAQLLSLPGRLVLEPYGIALQHTHHPLSHPHHPHPHHPHPHHPHHLSQMEAPAVPPPPQPRYHTFYSHRAPPGSATATAASHSAVTPDTATSTGLAASSSSSSRTRSTTTTSSSGGGVLRCAVLPPLRELRARSAGFRAVVAAGRAPSRGELLLRVVEQPLSELDGGVKCDQTL